LRNLNFNPFSLNTENSKILNTNYTNCSLGKINEKPNKLNKINKTKTNNRTRNPEKIKSKSFSILDNCFTYSNENKSRQHSPSIYSFKQLLIEKSL
jgi:hypothetical protein